MTTDTLDKHNFDAQSEDFAVAKASSGAPLEWIRHGVNDFRRTPGLSLAYGFAFAVAFAAVAFLAASAPWYTLAYLAALLAIGPFLASGIYAAGRELNRGGQPTLRKSLDALRHRKLNVALFSLMMVLGMAAWIRFSALMLALKVNMLSLSSEVFLSAFTSPGGWVAISFAAGAGLFLAAAVFMASAVAIPLILDRGVDFVTAVRTSFQAVARNRGVMALWALSILVLTAVGVATAFVGFLVIFPVLGFATWHSYRALLG